MNKTDLIEALAPRVGGRAAAGAAVEALVDVVLREVAAGGTVSISGFGSFERVDRAARTGRNPRTGEAVPIPETRSPRFRPGAAFREVVADPATLPAQGLAGARAAGESEGGSAGAPSTVRRHDSGPRHEPKGRVAARASSDRDRERRAPSGTPPSVRREKPDPTSESSEPRQPGSVGGGRVFSGGEDITAGMISAKKAQLAKVKNDDVSHGDSGKRKKAKKGKKSTKGKKGTKAAKKR
ncbi:hypothetical protein BJF80_02720 [Serinicoccus sp. CUA-874]|uniref:HU family DNA-binding protein n=1 Tax=Serinicoccus sp. CUA-874 TaxID=1517939 RepID=UPI00095EEAB3|nr:HU family DNA-binding protein [Serinicoccus sp. CUA-874]OLT17126.1 hypothetical protein BJF80_02720 [Serinicoccus sp. CUA-874]